jgi:16S rRNA (adenine1518-N6/adenine1519-N6)-dimethyltransferase
MHVNPKKYLSQNFLTNTDVQQRITGHMLNLISESSGYILEIGPGRGELTQHLLQSGKQVFAVEVDSEAVAYLSKYLEDPQLMVIEGSGKDIFLGEKEAFFDQHDLSDEFTFISNLPFHIGSRIMVDLPIHFPWNSFGVILQYEVIQKLLSDSTPTFFGFWINLFYDITYSKKISRHNFAPAPSVDCGYAAGQAIFNKGNLPDFLKTAEKRLQTRDTLKTLFGQPRKSIMNNAKALNLGPDKIDELKDWLEEYNWNRLSWENYEQVLEKVISLL